MSELTDIEALTRLIKLTQIMSRISRVSYLADQAKQRYPNIEMMRTDELEALSKMYLALGFDFEEAYKEWKKMYEEYKTGTTK